MKADNIGELWYKKLGREFKEPYMINLGKWLAKRSMVIDIYPSFDKTFRAFRLTPLDKVKVVILGQDPYHTGGVANGLAFASDVPSYIPPSLGVIQIELERDIKFGLYLTMEVNLEYWALQGVLLLNTILSVEQGKPKSHDGIGWGRFTKRVINVLNSHSERLVFMLWGNDAKSYAPLINQKYHLVLQAPHPISDIYGTGDFIGCGHFSKCNEFLEKTNRKIIKW